MLDIKVILALALLLGSAMSSPSSPDPIKAGPNVPAGGIPPPRQTADAGSFQ